MNNPIDYNGYEGINYYNGSRSPSGTVEYDHTTAYFWRALYQRVLSNFHFNIPAEWNMGYFKNVLFGQGFIGIIRTAQYGVIPQICTLTGYGLYLQPVELLVAQPLVNFRGRIGEDCEVIKLTPDYTGIMDIVEHYAVMLSKCATSINVSLINSRVSMIALAKNKSASEALTYIAEQISAGETLVVGDKILKDPENTDPIYMQFGEPAKNYITDKLLADFQTILNQFDREIGIPIVDQKKERMITDEVASVTSDAGSRIETWRESLTDSIGKVNDLFNLDISFEMRGGGADEGETNSNRSI